MAPKDQHLISQTLTGQADAFGVLVDRYSGLVYSVVLENVRRPEDVEDLVQEIFCKAYQQLPSLRRPASFPSWLGQIAHTTALTWLRQEKRRRLSESSLHDNLLPAAAPLPDRQTEAGQEAELLWRLLDQLPATQRRVVLLFYLEGGTYRQIARFLGKSVATVRWYLFQAERRLGRELGQRLGAEYQPVSVDRRRLRDKVLVGVSACLWPSARASSLGWRIPGRLLKLWRWPAQHFIALSLLGSALVHLLGIGGFEYWWRSSGGSAPTVRLVFESTFNTPARVARDYGSEHADRPGPAQELLALPAVTELLVPEFPRGTAAGPSARLALPDAGKGIVSRRPVPKAAAAQRLDPSLSILRKLAAQALRESLATQSLELLRLEDLDQANAAHAVVMLDSLDRRRLQGYLHFTGLRVGGSGSYTDPGHALSDLARYLSDYTLLKTRILNPHLYIGFRSAELLTFPIHFLFQGGGQLGWDEHRLTHFDEEELALLGKYLNQGGFLYVEGGGIYLRNMVRQVRQALGGGGQLLEVPFSHPLYHSFYDLGAGIPGEREHRQSGEAGTSWYYPAEGDLSPRQDPLGLWGVELSGEIVALFNDAPLLMGWPMDELSQDPKKEPPPKLFRLRAATNVVVYALTRTHSLAQRRERPLWQVLADQVIP